jgi:hypothetical protein
MKHAALPALFAALATMGISACSHLGTRAEVRPISSSNALSGSTDIESALRGARAHMQAGRYGLAISQFRSAALLDPDSAPAQNGLAVAYAAIGREDIARRYFERAIALAPQELSYRRNFARLNDALSQDGETRLAAGETRPGSAPRFAAPIVDVSRPVAQTAVVALHMGGDGRPRLEALDKTEYSPRLAVSTDGRQTARLVTRWPVIDRSASSAPAAPAKPALRVSISEAAEPCGARPKLSPASLAAGGARQLSTRIVTCRS